MPHLSRQPQTAGNVIAPQVRVARERVEEVSSPSTSAPAHKQRSDAIYAKGTREASGTGRLYASRFTEADVALSGKTKGPGIRKRNWGVRDKDCKACRPTLRVPAVLQVPRGSYSRSTDFGTSLPHSSESCLHVPRSAFPESGRKSCVGNERNYLKEKANARTLHPNRAAAGIDATPSRRTSSRAWAPDYFQSLPPKREDRRGFSAARSPPPTTT